MQNLLEETIQTLRLYGLSEKDIKWVGGDETWFTWEDFKLLANVDYDEDYGGLEVAEDLIIVGEDWWLERNEYDGREWWKMNRPPKKEDREYKVPQKIITKGYPLEHKEG